LQIHTLGAIWPYSVRGLNIADIGCGGISLLDYLKGASNEMLAVEPYEVFRTDLIKRGYNTYPYSRDTLEDWNSKVDRAFNIQVIELTHNPVEFLSKIRPLIATDGRRVISTLNRNDMLFELLNDELPAFFYRVVHRWYFNVESLCICAERAGFIFGKSMFCASTRNVKRIFVVAGP
jgi:hypothetical protein